MMKQFYFFKLTAVLAAVLMMGFSAFAQPIGSTLAKPVQVGILTPSVVFSDTKNNAPANGYLNNIGNPSDDIYYKFTISSGGMVSISHCSSAFDTYVHLLNANGAVIASNDDNGDLCKGVLQASLKLQLPAGTYYAVSEGWSSNYGNITTQISVSAEEIEQGFSQQMSQIFAALETSRVPYGLLQDIALEQASLANYKGTILADSNYVNKEEFNAVYQTLASARIHSNAAAFMPVKAIDSLAYLQREPGKIILSGLYYNYSRFTDNAVANNQITIANNQVYDKYIAGAWQNPYQTETAFALSPATQQYTGKSQQLLLPASLWFSNNNAAVSSLQVDAGDGLGYRTLTANQQLGLSYPDTGKKVITYKLNLTNGTALYSHSQIHIQSSVLEAYPGVQVIPITATEAFNGSFAKGTMSVLYANPALGMQKPLIVAEGFDMGRILNPEEQHGDNTLENFNKAITNSKSIFLKDLLVNNPQYDLVYVDWHEGTADIKKNAMLLKQVIREVNKRKALAGSTAKNVVMGISMGGLVARWALKDMENNNEPHQTKLYISYDSPHQGANVPLGYQYMAKHLSNLYIKTGITAAFVEIGSLISGNGSPYSKLNLTDQPAARQMLINYVNKNYQLDNSVHNQWQADLKAKGYPAGDPGSPIRKIAVSNGAQCGSGQEIVPGGQLLNFNGKASTTFLGDMAGMFVLPIAGALLNQNKLNYGILPGKNEFKLDLQINATGTGASSQVYHNKISYTKKVLWVIPVTKTITDITVSTGGMLPYDSFAGGLIDTKVNLADTSYKNAFIKYNVTASNKQTFGFIPTASAFDIGYGNVALSTADYQAKYRASAPPAAPKNTPFQNFITANYNPVVNEEHTTITEANGNWLAAELQNSNAPSADCTFACANFVITGPASLCTPAVYSLAGVPAGATVSWSATGAATILGANTGSSVTISRVTGGMSTITAVINSACAPVIVKKTITVASLPMPVVQRSLTPYFDQNAMTATANAAGAFSYDWETTGGLLINGYASPQANLSGVVTISSPNGDPGTVRVRSNTACGASQFAEICFSPASESLGNFQWLSYSNPLPGEPLVAQVDGLPNATAYQWYIDNTLIETTSSPSIYTHSWQCGDHGLGVVAVLDCGFSLPLGASYWGLCSGGYNFNIYPNPANSELTVSFSIASPDADKEKRVMRDFEIKLLDEQGRILREAKNPNNSRNIRVDTREIANGTYFLHIINGKEVIKKQVIIKH